ncbi:MAG: PAS domain S-box protein [Proteobacteria bacterium]|nr:PAS domain S-box protein [Pseudomonadota bacterium]MBU1611839.1 PAS domain S-box protein [Pseudomonadota bacterium]
MSDALREIAARIRTLRESIRDGEPLDVKLERIAMDLDALPEVPDAETIKPFMFMANAAKDSMTLISRDYVYDAANNSFAHAVSDLVDQPVGMSVSDVWGSDIFEAYILPALELCFNGEEVAYETWLRYPGRAKNGYYEVCYYPYRHEGVITHAVVISRDLTDWHRASLAARRSEDKYKNLVENLNDVIFSTNLQGELTYVSPTSEQLLGFKPDELMGNHFKAFIHPEDAEGVEKRFREVMEGNVGGHEYRIQTKWGGHIWVRSSSRILLEGGECIGITGSITDITESKLAAQALVRSERKYRNIFDNIQDVYFETTPEGIFLEISSSVFRVSGYKRIEVLGLDVCEFYDDPAEQRRFQALLRAHRRVEGFEMRLLDKDGEPHVCSVNAAMVRDDDRGGLKVVGSIHDITGLKRAEEELSRAKSFLDHIIDAVPDPIYVKDKDHKWVIVNRALGTLLGYPKDELYLKSVQDFFPADQAENFKRMDDLAFELGGKVEHEEEFWDTGGVWHVISTHKAVFDNPDKTGRLLAGVIRDITEQKRLEEVLRGAKEAAESLSLTKSRFLANMSHEIRTPLNGVIGMLQLVLMGSLEPLQREYANTAMTSAHGLLAVINDILDLSKIEAGKMEIVRAGFAVREMVDSVVQSMVQPAAAKGVELIVSISPDVPDLLSGGATRIRQILFNLLGNALKFTDRGQVEIEIAFLVAAVEARKSRLFVCVSDTGIGIPDESVERIFEDFAQADDSYTREYQGAGLGLSIVRRLVELMGGTVSIMSEVGVGTAVCFTVEVEEMESSEVGLRLANSREATTSRPLCFKRALVVEDNGVNQLLARRFLEKLGIETFGAANGLKALEELQGAMARGLAYDLVLMDIQMPVMDGIEATRRIRRDENPLLADVPVVALTAHAMEGDRERFLASGMNGYVSKPLELVELQRVLENL